MQSLAGENEPKTTLMRSHLMERMKAILILVAALAFAASPYFVQDFNGFDPDLYPNPQVDPPIQPAGYAFGIWGLIYLWLVLHAGFGLLRRDRDPAWDAVRWPLFFSLAIGASWLAVAERSPIMATILIWVMLGGSLAALYRSAETPDRWLLQAPIGVYAGWLTAASCASLGLAGAGFGWITDDVGWAWIGLVIVLGIGLFVQVSLARAPEYGLAIAWALLAIAIANGTDQIGIALAAGFGAVLMLSLSVLMLTRT